MMKKGGLYIATGDSITWTIPSVDEKKGSELYAYRIWQTINNYYQPIKHINKGLGGARTDEMVQNINWITQQEPDLVTIGVGMNDSANQATSVSEYKQNLFKLIQKFKNQNPNVSIVLCKPNTSTDPARSTLPEYRVAMEEVAQIEKVGIVPFETGWNEEDMAIYSGDGQVHPNAEGHRILSEILFPIIRQTDFVQSLDKKEHSAPSVIADEHKLDKLNGQTTGNPTLTQQGINFSGSDALSIPLNFDANSDFTIYIIAKPQADDGVSDRIIWSAGSDITTSPFMTITQESTGEISFTARNDAVESSGMTATTPTIRKDRYMIIELKRQGDKLTITELSSGASATSTLIGTFALNKQTFGGLGRTTDTPSYKGSIYYLLEYQRALNESERMKSLKYIKSELLNKNVLISFIDE